MIETNTILAEFHRYWCAWFYTTAIYTCHTYASFGCDYCRMAGICFSLI